MIGSLSQIEFEGKKEHQQKIDEFFLERTEDDKTLVIETEDGPLYFKVNATKGEIRFTILGSRKKDYHFYSEKLLDEKVIERIAEFLEEKRVDNIRLPLLSKEDSMEIQKKFEEHVPNYVMHTNLGSVCPVVDTQKFSKKKGKYMRPIRKYREKGSDFRRVEGFNSRIRRLHEERWGDNRSDEFYSYLEYMNRNDLSRSYGLYLDDKLISYVQVILTGNTGHYYYSIFDTDYDGAGSAIINYALKEALDSERIRYFSYGRGSEVFKHRWCTDIFKNYRLRGFLEEPF